VSVIVIAIKTAFGGEKTVRCSVSATERVHAAAQRWGEGGARCRSSEGIQT
jgi:hypothetical protein